MAKYIIKFFPLQKAFVVSPSPKFGFKGAENRFNFEWIFEDNAEIEIEWDKKSGKVEKPELVFFAESETPRESPIIVISGGKLERNIFFISDPDIAVIKIVKNKDGHHWGFSFNCHIRGVRYSVDPEMRVGTGENS